MGIGDFVSNLFGSKNKERAQGYNVDAGAYEYGGKPGGAQEAAQNFANTSAWSNQRNAPRTNWEPSNYDRDLQLSARQGQANIAGMMAQRAAGATPSIAQMQADRQMQQAAQDQASASASARGPAALALAQQNAAANTSNAQQNISNQAQINAANERLQAEQAAMGAFGSIRGQDLGSQQTNAQMAQFDVSKEMQTRGQNDQAALGWAAMQNQVNQSQLAANQNREAQRSSNALGAQGINAGVGGQNAAMNQQNAMNAVSMGKDVASAAGGVLSSDERLKQNIQPVGPGDLAATRFAPRTYGGPLTQEDIAAQAQAAADAEAEQRRWATWQAETNKLVSQKSPWEREVNREKVSRSLGFTPDEQDAMSAQRARGILAAAKAEKPADGETKTEGKAEEKKGQAADAKKEEKPSKVANIINSFGRWADNRNVDVSYRGGYGYTPPNLIPVSGSDIMAKTAIKSPASQMAGVSTDPNPLYSLTSSGGMDVGGTLAKMNQAAIGFQGDASGGMMAKKMLSGMGTKTGIGPITDSGMAQKTNIVPVTESDERAKAKVAPPKAGAEGPDRFIGLYAPPGKELHSELDSGISYYQDQATPIEKLTGGASLSGKSSRDVGDGEEERLAKASPKPVQGSGPKKMSDKEMLAWAKGQMAATEAQRDALVGQGPAVGGSAPAPWLTEYMAGRFEPSDEKTKKLLNKDQPMAGAARAMKSYEYEYKPEFTPPEQKPGEKNVGPMTQILETNPITRTMVKKDSNGMGMIDVHKAVKTNMAVSNGLQEQLDDQNQAISRLAEMMKRKRKSA